MIKHIVMFRFKDYAEGAAKEENLRKCKSMLEGLPDKIGQIRQYEVGINIKDSERSSDMVLISAFDSLTDLQTYSAHPEHKKVLEFISKVWEEVRAVDYEIEF